MELVYLYLLVSHAFMLGVLVTDLSDKQASFMDKFVSFLMFIGAPLLMPMWVGKEVNRAVS